MRVLPTTLELETIEQEQQENKAETTEQEYVCCICGKEGEHDICLACEWEGGAE